MTIAAQTNNTNAVPASINLSRIERRTIEVPVSGTSPLIVHRFDEKAKNMMLEAQQTKTRRKKDAKDPAADYERSRYLLPDGRDGFPAVAFKSAMVEAARLYEGVKMTELRPCLFVLGEGPDQLVPIIGNPRMREDTVRVGMGTADLRYRAEFWPWSAILTIRYIPSMISAESVIALLDAGGAGGIGEWRPSKSKTGIYGTFEVDAA